MFKRPTSHTPHTTSFAELRDIDSPAAARRVGAEFGREAHFAADLLRARPWLSPELSGREALSAILEGEWTGFLALLGEDGPWVYATSVRDLQELARLYATFRQGPIGATERAFWEAAAAQARAARERWGKA